MPRKITRIFFRLSGALFMFLLLFVVALLFAIQTTAFQTWLGRKVATYLGEELGTTLRINTIRLKFFSEAELGGVMVLDKHNDTLFAGDLQADISVFDLQQQKLIIEELRLNAVTAKLIKYDEDSVFNYDFIAGYFGGTSESSASPSWNVQVQNIILSDADLVYRNESRAGVPPGLMDYDDIYVQHISGGLYNIHNDSSGYRLQVKHLSAIEKSGFRLKDLSTEARLSATELLCENLRVNTPRSFVKGELRFRYETWDDYNHFISKVFISSHLEDSTVVDTRDIAFFAREVKGLDKTVALTGQVKGFVDDLHLDDFFFSFGHHTRFRGDLAVSGLMEYPSTFMHMDATELRTSYTDLKTIPAYPFDGGNTIQVPQEVERLGIFTYRGKLDGFTSDITTYGTLNTALGNVKTQLNLRSGEKYPVVEYNGRINTTAFRLGDLFRTGKLGFVSIDAHVNGKGLSLQNLDAEFEGQVREIEFNKYRYSNIRVNGSIREKLFTGLVISRDTNADFDFNGTINFHNKMPELDFIATINRLNLHKLNFTPASDSGYISSQILINIHGDNIDNLSGLINLDNTVYSTRSKKYVLSTFNIVMRQETDEKKIKVQSAYIDALVHGSYNLSDLPGAFSSLLYHYYPTFFSKPENEKRYSDHLAFRMRVKNFNSIVELLIPGFRISAGSRAEGDMDAAGQKLNFQFASPEISYGNLKLQDLLVILNETGNTVISEISGRSLRLTDSLGFSNFEFAARSVDKDSQFSLEWDDLKQPVSKGRIGGRVNFGNDVFMVHNDLFTVTINDSTWNLHRPYNIMLGRNGSISVEDLRLSNNNQVISVDGRLSDAAGDSLVLTAAHLSIEQFNPLLEIWQLNIRGLLDGHVALSRENSGLAFNGDLVMSEFVLNNTAIGALNVNANYEVGEKHILLNGYTSLGLKDQFGKEAKNISFDGVYHLDRSEESLDFDFQARPANLSVLNPFLTDILTIKHAYVTGEGKIHGTPADIKIDGKFKLFNSEVKVDYTNVSYNVTGLVEVMPDQIRFSDLLMRETSVRGAPQGTINGNIFHRNFDRMQIDYDVNYKNMLVLNTTEKDNSTFYGRIFASGTTGIYGYINDLHMEVTATTNRNSQFILPLDGPAEIGESDFIHFVKKDTAQAPRRRELSGFDLEMTIHATPEAQAQIILDKQHGDVLTAQGEGDLTLSLNTLGKFEMFGDYVITNGFYLFTLENVINKRFEIDPGSSISWSGNPYNAELDVVTAYRQRTSIAALLNDTVGTYRGRVPVECRLLIDGRLFSPQITFAVDFPTIDASAKARIASVLSDEAELNRQVFSFLLFRSFVTPLIFNPHGGGVTAGGAAASTGSEMLSNRVSEFLNTYFGSLTGISDLQLGLNYRPGSQNNTDAVDVALSKQFLNNKISVDGNFGVNNNAQMRNSGALIGDVNIEYKLSEDGRYRLKGFNRSNDNTQIATAGGPYTQGIGFFYREEFETFNDLFKRYLRKVKRKENAERLSQEARGKQR